MGGGGHEESVEGTGWCPCLLLTMPLRGQVASSCCHSSAISAGEKQQVMQNGTYSMGPVPSPAQEAAIPLCHFATSLTPASLDLLATGNRCLPFSMGSNRDLP